MMPDSGILCPFITVLKTTKITLPSFLCVKKPTKTSGFHAKFLLFLTLKPYAYAENIGKRALAKCKFLADELKRLRSEVIDLKKKLALAEEHREILIPTRGTKKSSGILHGSNAVKYAWIKA
ncbi:MAG: hypothetical protein HOP02_10040 [Methylococcaceae bacterium]|nr:hypothetical protein [Methylococcaceae bacterium]